MQKKWLHVEWCRLIFKMHFIRGWRSKELEGSWAPKICRRTIMCFHRQNWFSLYQFFT